jgi:hypothetical protein
VGSIKKLFESYGAVKMIEIVPSKIEPVGRHGATVTLARRIDAERAFNSLPRSANYGEPLLLSWVTQPPTLTESFAPTLTAAHVSDSMSIDDSGGTVIASSSNSIVEAADLAEESLDQPDPNFCILSLDSQ